MYTLQFVYQGPSDDIVPPRPSVKQTKLCDVEIDWAGTVPTNFEKNARASLIVPADIYLFIYLIIPDRRP
jgi:hypothetical protein